MRRFLLLGAGFSRNWGGWLGDEVFEYLLGCPQVDDDLRHLLWSHKRQGGFEDALAELQRDSVQGRDRLSKLQDAVAQMFNDMNRGFRDIAFEFQQQREYQVRTFLIRFDAIFTLNQDLLLESHYLDANVGLESRGRWKGWQLPGTGEHKRAGQRSPLQPKRFQVEPNQQPYFKLHGSSNWIDESSGSRLLVIGGGKVSTIAQHPILQWSHECFVEYLSSRDGARLIVIGYSFRDDHVNQVIRKAAAL